MLVHNSLFNLRMDQASGYNLLVRLIELLEKHCPLIISSQHNSYLVLDLNWTGLHAPESIWIGTSHRCRVV